ncbi:hypothetical protein NDU88_008320 [Pleurodeles waltl]|uniref:Uncharacterized protein n=1 Tax=Pleurodeles waltl TaxID=8319 RepID=A0AAV7NYY9_PLEWA|nr:hypothetical protein NDU88_008320 [Pleurodeles waltl]
MQYTTEGAVGGTSRWSRGYDVAGEPYRGEARVLPGRQCPQERMPEKIGEQRQGVEGPRQRDSLERGEPGQGGLQQGGTVQRDCCKRNHKPCGSPEGQPRQGRQGDSQMETPVVVHHTRSSKGEKEAMAPSIQAQFDQILATMADTKRAMQQDIGVVSVGLGLLRAEHRKLAEKMMEVEKVVKDMQPTQQELKKQMGELDERVLKLEWRAEDTEGCNRRNNVRVVGLPEGTEQSDMVTYLENWFASDVALIRLTSFFCY